MTGLLCARGLAEPVLHGDWRECELALEALGRVHISVIPAQAGIQVFSSVSARLNILTAD